MSKLYVFGIGGTGSRVIKSLSFLLASGVQCNSSSIIPIIIDPDAANGDVNKTMQILQLYKNIRKGLSFDGETSNQFFKTEIRPVNDSFRISIHNSNKKFKQFIDFQGLDRKNKALMALLFSHKNLDAELEVGFKGNPNMGSVVLNQFNTSEDFNNFASSFQQGDRIFIVSSIFGGTGAAGFPLLLKTIRAANPNLSNHALLKAAPIGAISVLPYFGVKRDASSDIEKSTFISKTKAALSYYEHGVNKGVNNMYYIGDKLVKDYENHEGSTKQQNDAHFIELASALAIIDFANDPNVTQNKVKEFGVENGNSNLTFKDLADKTKGDILKPLTQFYFFQLYQKSELRKNLGADFAKRLKLDEPFLNRDFHQKLDHFNTFFWNWLEQMSRNERGFTPYTLSTTDKDLFHSLNGYKPHSSFWEKTKNYERITSFLNKEAKELDNSKTTEYQFMELFHRSTKELMADKYKI